ncbi:hypothetical protein H1S01_16880 [Heliobacterium chlorum]|uniref:Tyr recombinase domain-containing protein n=1 Tax=Heliobacterium chlorum TaxID=2698 RepID=A0ABR7T7Q8_HELCL|nr:hypothetical protein [Heliobacterium chlorum]
MGLRRGELLGLRWQDIDFDRRILYVRQTLQRIQKPDDKGKKTHLIFQTPKTQRSKRPLPIPADLMIDIHKHKLSVDQDKEIVATSTLIMTSSSVLTMDGHSIPHRSPGCSRSC